MRILNLVAIHIVLIQSLRFDPEWKEYLVQEHNAYRSNKLSEPAANMHALGWSEEIEVQAEEWVQHLKQHNKCIMKHPEKGQHVPHGQNLARSRRNYFNQPHLNRTRAQQDMLQAAMENWGIKEQIPLVQEIVEQGKNTKRYAYGLGKFDHYSQMVWADTLWIGCAYVMCGNWSLTGCEYLPRGNRRISGITMEWYIKGNPCSACPDDETCDDQGLFCVPRGYI